MARLLHFVRIVESTKRGEYNEYLIITDDPQINTDDFMENGFKLDKSYQLNFDVTSLPTETILIPGSI